jgi:hypothetical protein
LAVVAHTVLAGTQAVAPRPVVVKPDGHEVHTAAELVVFVNEPTGQAVHTPLRPRIEALPVEEPLRNCPAGHEDRAARPVLPRVALQVLFTYCELLGVEHAKQEARPAVLVADVWYVLAGQAVQMPLVPRDVALPALYGVLM